MSGFASPTAFPRANRAVRAAEGAGDESQAGGAGEETQTAVAVSARRHLRVLDHDADRAGSRGQLLALLTLSVSRYPG